MAILRSPPVWFTLLLAALLVLYFGWLSISGSSKLAAAGLAGAQGRHNVEVVLNVDAEQYHMTRLQAEGRLVRFEGRSAFIMDMPMPALEDLSRNYWVAAIHSWSGS